MQPLDRSYLVKKYTNIAHDAWMTMHAVSTTTIYNITGIVSNLFLLACTPNKIAAGFEKTGIFPLTVNIFSELDFMLHALSIDPIY